MNDKQNPEARESFRVDLRGIVDVLSHHLYSSPTVFVRELLQNAVDALEARRASKKSHKGKVRFEVDESTRTIIVSDNGVGLTREQIEEFVASVGASNKRKVSADGMRTFIGQFGIGLLSGFMVADELLVLTRSVERGSPPLEWSARADGSYTIRKIDTKLSVGTRVILKLREDMAEYATKSRLAGLVRRYGEFLEYPVVIEKTGGDDDYDDYVSMQYPLWEVIDEVDDDTLESIGYELGFRPIDAIPIKDEALGLEAVAYVLSEPIAQVRSDAHKLYLKRMFVADSSVKAVPRWATFVRCVINSTELHPTASRESVCEDEVFHATLRVIGSEISDYLHRLARQNPSMLSKIISIHDESMRQIARDDEDFLRLVIDLLPFETSCGVLNFGDFRRENTIVRVATSMDQFRACAAIAAAQGVVVFNGGYTQHAELLERAVAIDPTLSLEVVDTRSLLESFSQTGDTEPGIEDAVIRLGGDALTPFRCQPLVRGFAPDDIPAVFAEGAEQSLARSLGAAKVEADGPWQEILATLEERIDEDDRGAFLCLNSRCDLVKALAGIQDERLVQAIVQVLYVQALLLGRQPLTEQETRAFMAAFELIVGAAAAGGMR